MKKTRPDPAWKGNEKKKKKKTNVKGKLTEPSEPKKKVQKLRLLLQQWFPPCVFNYENAIKNWILETENT